MAGSNRVGGTSVIRMRGLCLRSRLDCFVATLLAMTIAFDTANARIGDAPVAQDVRGSYTRHFGDLTVRFMGLRELVRQVKKGS